MSLKYLVVYEHRANSYSGLVPDMPGCIATGESLEDVQRTMRKSADSFIGNLKKHGEEIPKPVTTIVHFSHPSEGHGIDHWVVQQLEVATTAQDDNVIGNGRG